MIDKFITTCTVGNFSLALVYRTNLFFKKHHCFSPETEAPCFNEPHDLSVFKIKTPLTDLEIIVE